MVHVKTGFSATPVQPIVRICDSLRFATLPLFPVPLKRCAEGRLDWSLSHGNVFVIRICFHGWKSINDERSIIGTTRRRVCRSNPVLPRAAQRPGLDADCGLRWFSRQSSQVVRRGNSVFNTEGAEDRRENQYRIHVRFLGALCVLRVKPESRSSFNANDCANRRETSKRSAAGKASGSAHG